jgi:hypothetical protein
MRITLMAPFCQNFTSRLSLASRIGIDNIPWPGSHRPNASATAKTPAMLMVVCALVDNEDLSEQQHPRIIP